MFERLGLYAGIAATCIAVGFFSGCEMERERFDQYKARMSAAAEAQAANTNHTIEKQRRAADEAKTNYDRRIADIRRYYSGLYNDGGSTLPAPSGASTGPYGGPSYGVLIEQCAETTQQLIDLQDFINNTKE